MADAAAQPAYSSEPTDDADIALIRAAREGDRNAFTGIVRRYSRRVYRAAYFLLHNVDDASDVTQETFIRAFGNLARFEVGRPLFPWLRRIARNLALNVMGRAEYRVTDLPEDETIAGASPAPGDDLLRDEATALLYRAINQLSHDHREIIMLKHFEDCSYADIADILGIPIGTVMSRLYNARTTLREILLSEER